MTLSKPKPFKPSKEFKANYLKDFKEPIFEPVKVPWINEDLIKLDISTTP